MVWTRPPVLPVNLSNTDQQQDTHPEAHNKANQAINDIASHVGVNLPMKVIWGSGGFTTNGYGGIEVAVPFTVIGAVAVTGQVGYSVVHPTGAPANTLWLDVFGITGQLVPNTFILFNYIAWG